MNAKQIKGVVESQIGDVWDTTNLHGVSLREALIPPQRITVIERFVRDGKTRDQLVGAWLVLVEDPKAGAGYRIVASDDGSIFGLVAEGFPSDAHLVLCGWYGDFLTTFHAM